MGNQAACCSTGKADTITTVLESPAKPPGPGGEKEEKRPPLSRSTTAEPLPEPGAGDAAKEAAALHFGGGGELAPVLERSQTHELERSQTFESSRKNSKESLRKAADADGPMTQNVKFPDESLGEGSARRLATRWRMTTLRRQHSTAASIASSQPSERSQKSVEGDIERFEADRMASRMKRLFRVARFGVAMAGFGMFMSGAFGFLSSMAGRKVEHMQGIDGAMLALSLSLFSSGLVILSTCPVPEVDIDVLMDSKCLLRTSCGLCVCLHGLHTARQTNPPTCVIQAFIGLALAKRSRASPEPADAAPRAPVWHTRAFCLYFPSVFFGRILPHLLASQAEEYDEAAGKLLQPTGAQWKAMHIAVALCAVCSGVALSALPRWLKRRDSTIHNTVVMFYAMYAFIILQGFEWFLKGCFCAHERDETAVARMMLGLFSVLPVAAVLVVGRQKMFALLGGRRHEEQQAANDGAFIAALLESVPVKVGKEWWVHRETPAKEHREGDIRRMWRLGNISEIREKGFTVKVKAGQADMIEEFDEDGGRVWKKAPDKFNLPLPERGLDPVQLRKLARDNLRCIEWDNLTLELLTGELKADKKSQDEWNKLRLKGLAPKENFYHLSRAMRPGEVPDFFFSHSWYDDPYQKYAKLEELAEQFRLSHGRFPTFWLDKVCIDQENIGDGLKALPVIVMSCKRFLSVCGPTYATRLWCAWELFTLFAFVDQTSIRQKLALVTIEHADPGAQQGASPRATTVSRYGETLQQLCNFDVANARCYDPNEEARLRFVIQAMGAERFNQRIRDFALSQRQQRSGADSEQLWEALQQLQKANLELERENQELLSEAEDLQRELNSTRAEGEELMMDNRTTAKQAKKAKALEAELHALRAELARVGGAHQQLVGLVQQWPLVGAQILASLGEEGLRAADLGADPRDSRDSQDSVSRDTRDASRDLDPALNRAHLTRSPQMRTGDLPDLDAVVVEVGGPPSPDSPGSAKRRNFAPDLAALPGAPPGVESVEAAIKEAQSHLKSSKERQRSKEASEERKRSKEAKKEPKGKRSKEAKAADAVQVIYFDPGPPLDAFLERLRTGPELAKCRADLEAKGCSLSGPGGFPASALLVVKPAQYAAVVAALGAAPARGGFVVMTRCFEPQLVQAMLQLEAATRPTERRSGERQVLRLEAAS